MTCARSVPLSLPSLIFYFVRRYAPQLVLGKSVDCALAATRWPLQGFFFEQRQILTRQISVHRGKFLRDFRRFVFRPRSAPTLPRPCQSLISPRYAGTNFSVISASSSPCQPTRPPCRAGSFPRSMRARSLCPPGRHAGGAVASEVTSAPIAPVLTSPVPNLQGM